MCKCCCIHCRHARRDVEGSCTVSGRIVGDNFVNIRLHFWLFHLSSIFREKYIPNIRFDKRAALSMIRHEKFTHERILF